MKKQADIFKGFTPEGIQFFNDLKENNYKEWFDNHKYIYEKEILQPLKAFVTTLSPLMYNIDPAFELRPQRAMSRIYRDIRFSKNKTPYKTAMWITFQIPVSRDIWTDYPGYYFEITGNSYSYGMGLFMPKKKVMDAFREEITYDAEEFKRMTKETVVDKGFEIGGETYKRPIANDLPEYYQQWIQRKGIYVFKEKHLGNELFSPDFTELIGNEFKNLEWLYNFFKEVSID